MSPKSNASEEARANLERLEVPGRDGSVQKEVLIAWDIENARMPSDFSAEQVEK